LCSAAACGDLAWQARGLARCSTAAVSLLSVQDSSGCAPLPFGCASACPCEPVVALTTPAGESAGRCSSRRGACVPVLAQAAECVQARPARCVECFASGRPTSLSALRHRRAAADATCKRGRRARLRMRSVAAYAQAGVRAARAQVHCVVIHRQRKAWLRCHGLWRASCVRCDYTVSRPSTHS